MATQKARAGMDPSGILKSRDEQVFTLNQLAASISQTRDLGKALDSTLTQLCGFIGADFGSVHLMDSRDGSLKMISGHRVSPAFTCAENRIPVGECLCGLAASTGEVVSSPDLSLESRMTRTACREEHFESVISIPLKSRDRVLGLLTLYAKRPQAFSDSDQNLLLLVGDFIGLAIENAQLYAHTREMAIHQERGLIAREIHDGIAQSLAYLNMETKKLENLMKGNASTLALVELDQIRQVVRDTYDDVRQLLVDFRTGIDEDKSLRESLTHYVKEFSRRIGIKGEVTGSSNLPQLPLETRAQLFRIVQEALSNVRKHARARTVGIWITASSTDLMLKIQDDGCGFNPELPMDPDHVHVGLEIMKERVAGLKGDLRLESAPGQGTTLHVSVPLTAGG